MHPKFVDYSNICWATISEVARSEFAADKLVDVYVDYRFWNDLNSARFGGAEIDQTKGCLVYIQALEKGYIQRISVFVGAKNSVTFMNKVDSEDVYPAFKATKVVSVVGFPIRD